MVTWNQRVVVIYIFSHDCSENLITLRSIIYEVQEQLQPTNQPQGYKLYLKCTVVSYLHVPASYRDETPLHHVISFMRNMSCVIEYVK